MKLKLFPRGIASLTLAVAAVPGVTPPAGPTTAPMIPAPAPGGWTRQDPGSAGVRQAAQFAVTNLGLEFGRSYVVERIRQADAQVVEGVNYRVRMRIAEVQDEILGARKDCTVFVWSRPWMKPADVLTSFTCQAEDADR